MTAKKRFKQFTNRNLEILIALALIGVAVVLSVAWSSLYYWHHSPLTLILIWLIGFAYLYNEANRLLLRKNKYTISPEKYRSLVRKLEQRAGLQPCKVILKQSKVQRAGVIGFGSMSAIVLSSALCEELPKKQLEAVLAHELGHIKYRDRLIYTFLGLTVLDSLAIISVSITRAVHGGMGVMFLLSSLLGICVLLAGTKYSRYSENRADHYGVTLTGKPNDFSQALASMLSSFTERRGWTIRPEVPRWIRILNTHPPIHQRIKEYAK